LALTTEQIAAKTLDLANLKTVKLRLNSGQLQVSTTIDGNSVTFQKVNPVKLEQYIAALQTELAPYDAGVSAPCTEITCNNNRMFC